MTSSILIATFLLAYQTTTISVDAFVSTRLSSSQHRVELFLASSISAPSLNRRRVSSSLDVRLLEPIGNGTFGGVYWAEDGATGKRLVAKSARAATTDERAEQNARSYLEIEAYINSKLCPSNNHDTQQQLAPYLGEAVINQTMYLIWESSGEYTLEDYIEMEDGWVQLANDLGVKVKEEDEEAESHENDSGHQSGREKLHQKLAREVLRQLLEGMAYCHSLGVIHRDVKPANVLVDPTTKTLRFLDFGSACDMSSWTTRAGYRGQNKGPRSILYCAPEEFVNEEHPYSFDIYGVAITWLRTILAEDSPVDEDGSRQNVTFGLGDEEHLFQWRIAVRDFMHNLVSYEEYAVLHNTLPYGWRSLFGTSREGIQALRLLSNMMSYSPDQRISASEALLGPYLNPGCDAEPPPELPPAMPWSIMSHVQRWKKERKVHSWQDEECSLEDLFTEVVAVELQCPLGLQLAKKANGNGVIVSGIINDAAKQFVRYGDVLLAIGSIDVENASLEHVNELLDQWPKESAVPLLLVRDSV